MAAPVLRGDGVRPKSAVLAVTIYVHHRPALEYDLLTRAGFGVDRIDREEIPWSQMVALIDGLMNDHTSHTFASVAGWAYVPSPEEVAFYNDVDVRLAMNRGKNQPMPQPVKRPWEQGKAKSVLPRNDAETRTRRQLLNERLGLGRVVDTDDKPDRQPQSECADRHDQVESM